jgi:hypothetical protein
VRVVVALDDGAGAGTRLLNNPEVIEGNRVTHLIYRVN